MEIDWEAIVISEAWIEHLERLALRRFGEGVLADEASTFVLDRISENNWSKLSQFRGKAKPETFLYKISSQLLEEFSRQRFGRLRPPAWLEREGGLWLRIWKMLCLERQPSTRVTDILSLEECRDKPYIEAIQKTIKARIPDCGITLYTVAIDHTGSQNEADTSNSSAIELKGNATLEQSLGHQELEEVCFLFAELLENLDCPSNSGMNDNIQHWKDLSVLQESINLSEEETLVLRMAFQEGLQLKVIAQALSMPAYQPGRMLKRLFSRISESLRATSVDMEHIASLLVESET